MKCMLRAVRICRLADSLKMGTFEALKCESVLVFYCEMNLFSDFVMWILDLKKREKRIFVVVIGYVTINRVTHTRRSSSTYDICMMYHVPLNIYHTKSNAHRSTMITICILITRTNNVFFALVIIKALSC